MKRILIFFTAMTMLVLISCSNNKDEYSEVEWLDTPINDGWFYNEAEPLIREFDGERFADKNITADAYYSGYTNLSDAGDVIYCEDDGSIIWFELGNGITRLKKDGTTERLCVVDECRENPDERCTHMSYYWGSHCYSNGVLYLGISGWYYAKMLEGYLNSYSYVLAYDIQTHKVQKLADVDFNEENEEGCGFEYINSGEENGSDRYGYVNMNGRYLYLTLYSRYYFTKVIRVDLYDNTATILIDDNLTFEKLGYGRLYFYKESFFTASGGEIYLWDMDMNSCSPIVESDDGNVIIKQIYDDMLYYFKYPKDSHPGDMPYELYRYDLRRNNDPVLLNGNIQNIYIYEDTLYYTMYNGGEVLAAPIVDTDRKYITWDGSYSVYYPEGGDTLAGSGFFVKNGYIYTTIYTERVEKIEQSDEYINIRYRASVRVEPHMNRTDYIFFG